MPNRKAWVLLLTAGCCGLGTELPGVTAVVIHDSDWNPRADMQALKHARRIGTGKEGLPVLRLYVRGTLEERILQLGRRGSGMDAVYASSHGTR